MAFITPVVTLVEALMFHAQRFPQSRFTTYAVALVGLTVLGSFSIPARADLTNPAEYNKALGRGINLGNALEAPREGEWGMTLEADYFARIKDAGFNSVRIPVRWSAHAARNAPYTIDPAFLKRVRWAVDQALSHQLATVLNVHHYEELYANPQAETARFLAIWKQIAEHFQSASPLLSFEILNEPHDKLDNEQWSRLFPLALAAIRESNPSRIVIIGPPQWNNFRNLNQLTLPENDRHLVATFHYYEPFPFTHQGASWAQGSDRWLGTTWTATTEQLGELQQAFNSVADWSRKYDRPIYLGEFGAYSRAPLDSRVTWTSHVAREAEKRGFSWAYWEFGAGFGAYDRDRKSWRAPLLNALIPPTP